VSPGRIGPIPWAPRCSGARFVPSRLHFCGLATEFLAPYRPLSSSPDPPGAGLYNGNFERHQAPRRQETDGAGPKASRFLAWAVTTAAAMAVFVGLCAPVFNCRSTGAAGWLLFNERLASLAICSAAKACVQYFLSMAPVQAVYSNTQRMLRSKPTPASMITQSIVPHGAAGWFRASACVAASNPASNIDAERMYWQHWLNPQPALIRFFLKLGLYRWACVIGISSITTSMPQLELIYFSGAWTARVINSPPCFSPGPFLFRSADQPATPRGGAWCWGSATGWGFRIGHCRKRAPRKNHNRAKPVFRILPCQSISVWNLTRAVQVPQFACFWSLHIRACSMSFYLFASAPDSLRAPASAKRCLTCAG